MSNHFQFAQRTNWSLMTNQLTDILNKLRKDNVDIIDLTEANPTHCDFPYPQEKILNPLADPSNLKYQPSPQGILKAREALRDDYQRKGMDVPTENIFLTASTSEAYSYLFRLLLNTDERVLFPQPSYPLFHFLADLNDVGMDFLFS